MAGIAEHKAANAAAMAVKRRQKKDRENIVGLSVGTVIYNL
jgi:hypothetical protein